MIIATNKDEHRYAGISSRLQEALQWLQTVNTTLLQEGTNPIKGTEIFCNVCVYNTALEEERVWESHQKYIDIHFMIEGEEYIHVSSPDDMNVKQPYNEETDFCEWSGTAQQKIYMQPGMFLIAFPEDIHRTAVRIESAIPRPVRKGILKVLL